MPPSSRHPVLAMEYPTVNRWNSLMDNYHGWRTETGFATKLLLVFIFAELTAFGALARIYTPFTPVPFTLQTFFVLLSGVMLGRYWGGLSQVLYIAIGFVGVPWFAGATGGVDIVFGATGGYLLGFVLAALLIGEMTEKRSARDWKSLFPLMTCASMLILLCGTIGLVLLGFSIGQAFVLGFIPFVGVELVKALAAGGAANFLTQKQ